MKKGDTRSISRIRTFDADSARLRGVEIPVAPKVERKEKTAQTITDDLLKVDVNKAVDFIGITDETISEIPTEEILDVPKAPKKKTQPVKKITNLVDTPKIEKPPLRDLPALGMKNIMPSLEDEMAKIDGQKTSSVQSNEGAVYDVSNNDLSEGTLITNKKNTKFRLIPAIFRSIRSWFGVKKAKITTSQKQVPIINKAESRIATITAAARASKHAPQSDHGVIVKRLTKTKRSAIKTEVQIKKKEDVAAPQWGTLVAEDTQAQLLTDEPILVAPTEIPVETAEVIPEPPVETVPEPETPTAPIPTPKPEKIKKEKKPKKEKKKKSPAKKKVSWKKRAYRATPTVTSGVPVYVYAMVIVGASLLGIGTTVYLFTSVTPEEQAVIIRIPSLVDTQTKVPVTLTTSRTDTLSTILDVSFTTRETVQIYPTVVDTTGLALPADAQTMLNALGFRTPGSFTRAVTNMTFGSYNGTDPFIVMEVTNFDTAFGGLLAWEPDMSADLSPLFGGAISQSFDPYARTDTQIRSAFFRDTIVSNKSARVLVDPQNNERIIYAFINPNLVLITTTAEAFSAIVPLVIQ